MNRIYIEEYCFEQSHHIWIKINENHYTPRNINTNIVSFIQRIIMIRKTHVVDFLKLKYYKEIAKWLYVIKEMQMGLHLSTISTIIYFDSIMFSIFYHHYFITLTISDKYYLT